MSLLVRYALAKPLHGAPRLLDGHARLVGHFPITRRDEPILVVVALLKDAVHGSSPPKEGTHVERQVLPNGLLDLILGDPIVSRVDVDVPLETLVALRTIKSAVSVVNGWHPRGSPGSSNGQK